MVNACIITVHSHPVCLLDVLVTVCNSKCLNCRSHQRIHNRKKLSCARKSEVNRACEEKKLPRQETQSNQTEKGEQLWT